MLNAPSFWSIKKQSIGVFAIVNIFINFKPKETSYVTDYLSGANNDLMTYEKGFGTTRVTYEPGYQRISQKVPPSRISR